MSLLIACFTALKHTNIDKVFKFSGAKRVCFSIINYLRDREGFAYSLCFGNIVLSELVFSLSEK